MSSHDRAGRTRGRYPDDGSRAATRGRIVEVPKKTPDSQIDSARERIARVDTNYAALLEELLNEAREEREQERDRGSIR